jgi:Uma2 family endonuclease
VQKSKRHYTVDEYFYVETTSDIKHEYFDGEIFAMAGGSRDHDRISRNVLVHLHQKLTGSLCEAFTSNMRIRTPSGLYTYPDASIVCGAPDIVRIQGTDTIGNPVVLVEVLSESTGEYDRGQKFDLYRSIPALRDYVLIDQSRVQVEHRRLAPNGEWVSDFRTSLDESIRLVGVELDLPLAGIYAGVGFDRS